jgi:uncharacterized membrane protein
MEISKNDMNVLKGIAILMMLLLHLFATKDVNGLYDISCFDLCLVSNLMFSLITYN